MIIPADQPRLKERIVNRKGTGSDVQWSCPLGNISHLGFWHGHHSCRANCKIPIAVIYSMIQYLHCCEALWKRMAKFLAESVGSLCPQFPFMGQSVPFRMCARVVHASPVRVHMTRLVTCHILKIFSRDISGGHLQKRKRKNRAALTLTVHLYVDGETY